MLIDGTKLSHWINNFFGYGSWHAKMWFIGYEDTGGDVPEEVADKINFFFKEHPPSDEPRLCDIRTLYRNVRIYWDGPKADQFANRFEYRFGDNAVVHGVWKNLIAFEHGYWNNPVPDVISYQKQTLASPDEHREALIPLYPLPSPHGHAWYYSWLDLPNLRFIKHRAEYELQVYPRRIQTILSNIVKYKPEVVLMYGMNNINTLKKSIQDFIEGAKFRQVKAVPRKIPQHHRADIGETTLIITTQIPALRHNRVETGFDWEAMGREAGRSKK